MQFEENHFFQKAAAVSNPIIKEPSVAELRFVHCCVKSQMSIDVCG